MTLCIAALADDRRTILIAADKMVSTSFIQSQLPISKIFKVHSNWYAMVAANALPGAFPIIDDIRERLQAQTNYSVNDMTVIASQCYQKERLTHAEGQFLSPRGLDINTFLNNGKDILPELTLQEINRSLGEFNLGVSLLICGFDVDGTGQLFTVRNPGIAERHDIPGFAAIGSGYYGAFYMMLYRELGPSTPASDWLYYIWEAKGFGEQAGGVGEQTDLFIAKRNNGLMRVDKLGYHDTLDLLWAKYRPGHPVSRDRTKLKKLYKKLVGETQAAQQSERDSNQQ